MASPHATGGKRAAILVYGYPCTPKCAAMTWTIPPQRLCETQRSHPLPGMGFESSFEFSLASLPLRVTAIYCAATCHDNQSLPRRCFRQPAASPARPLPSKSRLIGSGTGRMVKVKPPSRTVPGPSCAKVNTVIPSVNNIRSAGEKLKINGVGPEVPNAPVHGAPTAHCVICRLSRKSVAGADVPFTEFPKVPLNVAEPI
jgi:hypothetical protein